MAETTQATPEVYIRTNIEKNSKGLNYETTVSVRWVPVMLYGMEDDENDDLAVALTEGPAMIEGVLGGLLRRADDIVRSEIARREDVDRAAGAQ